MRKTPFNFKMAAICTGLLWIFSFAHVSFAQKTHHYKPKKFYYTYDARHKPVLKLNPGDTLITHTIDAFGNKITTSEQRGSEVVHLPHVNDQTGPFYVRGAEPGDTLVLHLLKVRPNRDFAVSNHLPHFGDDT